MYDFSSFLFVIMKKLSLCNSVSRKFLGVFSGVKVRILILPMYYVVGIERMVTDSERFCALTI